MRSRARDVVRPELQTIYLDTELGLLHAKHGCPEAKVAAKYRYLVNVTGTDHLSAKAKGLGWKACPRCGEGLVSTTEGVAMASSTRAKAQ